MGPNLSRVGTYQHGIGSRGYHIPTNYQDPRSEEIILIAVHTISTEHLMSSNFPKE